MDSVVKGFFSSLRLKSSFLFLSFLLILAKREILFKVTTFDVSLFLGGRYPFEWSLPSEGLYFQCLVTFGTLRYMVCYNGYAPLSKIYQLSPEFIAVVVPNSTFKCRFHVQGSNKLQECFSLPHTSHKNDARA